MHNIDIINHFYTSLQNGDAEEMVNCYDANIIFKDPVFGELTGLDAMNMWLMLIEKSKGQLKITFDSVEADNKSGSAMWIANYIFSKTGRPIHNVIKAQFEFQNGKIIRHTDHFDIWKWSQQAFGWKGLLLGWTPFMKAGIRKFARISLNKYTQGLELP